MASELWFDEFGRKFDELDARSERRWSAMEQRGASVELRIGVPKQTGATLLVESDNWGGEFEEPSRAMEGRDFEPAATVAASPLPVTEQLVLVPAADAAFVPGISTSVDSVTFPVGAVAPEFVSTTVLKVKPIQIQKREEKLKVDEQILQFSGEALKADGSVLDRNFIARDSRETLVSDLAAACPPRLRRPWRAPPRPPWLRRPRRAPLRPPRLRWGGRGPHRRGRPPRLRVRGRRSPPQGTRRVRLCRRRLRLRPRKPRRTSPCRPLRPRLRRALLRRRGRPPWRLVRGRHPLHQVRANPAISHILLASDDPGLLRYIRRNELSLVSRLPRPDDFVKDADSCMYTPTNCSTQVFNGNSYRNSHILHHTNDALIPDAAGFMVVEFQSVVSTWASSYNLSPYIGIWYASQDAPKLINSGSSASIVVAPASSPAAVGAQSALNSMPSCVKPKPVTMVTIASKPSSTSIDAQVELDEMQQRYITSLNCGSWMGVIQLGFSATKVDGDQMVLEGMNAQNMVMLEPLLAPEMSIHARFHLWQQSEAMLLCLNVEHAGCNQQISVHEGTTLFLSEASKLKLMWPMFQAPWSSSLLFEINGGEAQLNPFCASYTTPVFWTTSRSLSMMVTGWIASKLDVQWLVADDQLRFCNSHCTVAGLLGFQYLARKEALAALFQ